MYPILHLQLLGYFTKDAQLEELEAYSYFKQQCDQHPTMVSGCCYAGNAKIENA